MIVLIEQNTMSPELQSAMLKAIQVAYEPPTDLKGEIHILENMKFYRLKAWTPYAGEELEDVVMVASDSELYNEKDKLMEECADEWAPCFEEDYYANCFCIATEITHEEYVEGLMG